jgi:hypothetical protein
MFLFSRILRSLIYLNLKVRSRKWPEDYYIYRDDKRLLDSHGNIYHHSWESYVSNNSTVLNAAGHIWEIYEEVDDRNF